ncbi:MAG: outer membrane insertion C- signal [Oscillospiraceae bacterium]|nr:outer membrane insertion C- signal [Oscillospiraceae bacterium]
MRKELPVYLFLGFLESGKTRFVQETMEDPRFDSGKRTLLLVCEEGEEEFNPARFAFKGVTIKYLSDKSEFNPENLAKLEDETRAGRVVIEYNGMWTMQEFYEGLPENWILYQCLMTADGTTALTYARDNAMRSLFLDKIAPSELIVFNRAEKVDNDEARQELHKLVRQVSRKCDIAYEFADGSVTYDDIPDPLPFDMSADVIGIGDEDFGIWFLDCQENPQKYEGRKIRFLAQVYRPLRMGTDSFVAGRFAMTCCAADIQFVGYPCSWSASGKLQNRQWVTVTARVQIKNHSVYKGKKGPVLTGLSVEPAQKPQEDVVTFS